MAPILHVVGARPQFVKVAALLRATSRPELHSVIHTGQHYDPGLSKIFFDELGIPSPRAHLGVGGGSHGAQTADMLKALEPVLQSTLDATCVVYGDTNSTLAAALAAAKLGMRLVHVEAGLRAGDRRMPEEINRIVTDHVSDVLLCPTPASVVQLAREGLTLGVHLVGDVMLDVALTEAPRARATPLGRYLAGETDLPPPPFTAAMLPPAGYFLATIHRAANTDDPEVLARLVSGLAGLGAPVVWPMHPRTREAMARNGLRAPLDVHTVDPLGYLEFSALLQGARAVLTDSGGVQKEAWFAGKPCVTLRDSTEWIETLAGGWNTLVGDDLEALRSAIARPAPLGSPDLSSYGGGSAAKRCIDLIERGAGGGRDARRCAGMGAP